MSHPTRVRGLKSVVIVTSINTYTVAPYTGAWIEMLSSASYALYGLVAPYTGAWIEIATV